MASSFHKTATLCLLVSSAASVVGAQQSSLSQKVVLDADNWSFDQENQRYEFKGLRITQSGLSIEADHALGTGLDFASNRWQLTGNVRIVIDTAVVTADAASFVFENHELVSGLMTGSPATFDDTSPTRDRHAHGGSNEIHYSSADGTVRMEGDASLVVGQFDAQGCALVYSLRDSSVSSGGSDCGEKFRITVNPAAEENAPNDTPAAP